MKILLDTHIWLWLALVSDDLSKRHRVLLERDDVQLWLSPISMWEACMLSKRSRVSLRPTPTKWIESSIDKLQLTEAPFTWAVSYQCEILDWDHKDPADRFLVSTALVHDLKFATQDANIIALPGLQVV